MGSIQATQPTEPSTQQTPFNLTEVDRQILSQTDESFVYHDWADLKDIIARNDLAVLRRKPSDLRRYIAWTNDIKATYGTIIKYICLKRLRWWSLEDNNNDKIQMQEEEEEEKGKNLAKIPIPEIPYNNPTPFADPADYKILRNDWPYGVTPDITHIVVWSKTPIPTRPDNGDVTDTSRALIEEFVDRTFVQRLQQEEHAGVFAGMPKEVIRDEYILWFKNWTSLQSVRSLEHFHVLVRGVPDSVITEWTHEQDLVR